MRPQTVPAYCEEHADQTCYHLRGIVQFKLASHEQKPFANAFSHGLPNFFYRGKQTWARWLPTFIIGYLIYRCAEARHAQLKRKNVALYAGEVNKINTPTPVEFTEPKKKDPICFQVVGDIPDSMCKEEYEKLPPECRGKKGELFDEALRAAKESDASSQPQTKKPKNPDHHKNKISCDPPTK